MNIAFVGKTPVGVVKRWPDDGSVAGAGAWRWWVDNLSCWPGTGGGCVQGQETRGWAHVTVTRHVTRTRTYRIQALYLGTSQCAEKTA